MAFTSQQQIAISQHSSNMIVTAGAGSGKTRVLIERFLALLRANPDWKITQIVAITFTEKAAREMRERLRGALQDQALNATEIEAQQRWRQHETLLESAYISTIHALCQQILREHPARVPVDPGFTILDENESALLIREAIERTLAAWVTFSRPWAELLYRYDPQDVKRTLTSFIERSSAAELGAAIPSKPAEILSQWTTQRENVLTQWATSLKNDAALSEALAWQPPIGWSAIKADDKRLMVWEQVRNIIPNLSSPDEESVYQAILDLSSSKVINLRGGTAKNWGGQEILDEAKQVLEFIRDKCRACLETYPAPLADIDSEAARLLPLWAEAIQDAAAHYSSLKDERAALDFDDLEALTLDLLERDPSISAYYQAGFQQIMVDEFQDTNQRQRRIVECLCGDDRGRLFVVGDPKQSIYAFRGADVSVFNDVKAQISANGHEQALSTSFRTHNALVAAFNACFSRLLMPDPESPIYPYEVDFEPLQAHRPSQIHHHRAFNVLRLHKPDKAQAEDAPKLSSEDLRRYEAAEIAAWLQELQQERVLIYDKNLSDYRPFQYGDAALLLRSFTDVNLYEDGFKAAGIPYITLSGRGYFDRQEVWDILNLLRALHNPADELALASALRSPLFGLSDEALFALRLLRDANNRPIPLMLALNSLNNLNSPPMEGVRGWSEAVDAVSDGLKAWTQNAWGDFTLSERDKVALSFAADAFQRWRGLAGRVAAADLIESILAETAYDAILSALPDGDRRRGNLDKLLRQARASGRVALGEFLRYVQDLTSVEPREGEAAIESLGAVQIMTVHRSKGLEFPVVIVADASREPRKTHSPLLLNDPQLGASCLVVNEANEKQKPFSYSQAEYYHKLREGAENKRLFYVAATRAADYLLVSGTDSKNWLGWLDEMLSFDAEGDYSLDDTTIYYRPISLTAEDAPEKPKPSANPVSEGAAFYLFDNLNLDDLLMDDPATGEPIHPRLIVPLAPINSAALRHLSVTQLEQLGSISAYDPQSRGARRFRHSLLHDAPPPLRPLSQSRNNERHHARLLGQIVHRALQTGAIPSRYAANPDGLAQIIGAYAWDAGFTEEKSRAQIVAQALNLLQTFGLQGEPETLARADGEILREVPFIYQVAGRVLHGVIDALYQIGGQWHVLDYKTPPIRAERASQHAQRYAIQLGAYARAVQARTAQIPITQIYYLHAGKLITIPPATWQAALDGLDAALQNALRLSEQDE